MAEAISSGLIPSGPSLPARPASSPSAPGLGPQLPVVDLIGLRFSLQHLRLVGYGLLAVWLAEIVTMLNAPDLSAISSRLHYISQFLDLSPILLASIGLIAYQGGLRRTIWEVLLLPLLLSLLLLLSAFHFFLAPLTVANAVTLVQKQEEIGMEQMERIDQQIDRAATILRESDNIDSLLAGLQRIPGLQVQLPEKAPVLEARREVRISLERDRDQMRERIRSNISASRAAFYRRAATNAALALLVGLVLWGLHHGAMREMQQSVPFLEWVLVHGEVDQSQDVLRELLRFQRACLALGWFSLFERSLGLMRVVMRPAEAESSQPLASDPVEDPFPPAVYPPPFEAGRLSIPNPPSRFLPFRAADAGLWPYRPGDRAHEEGGEERHASPAEWGEASLPFWERRRRERQRRLAREALRRQGASHLFQDFQGGSPAPGGENPSEALLSPAQMRARQRDLRRSREAMRRFADPEFLAMMGHQAPPEASAPRSSPSPLDRLRRWFLTHL
jgi:hypothetical protein